MTTSSSPSLSITIGGREPDEEFFDGYTSLEVEDNSTSASTFRIKLSYMKDKKGDWIFDSEKYLKMFEKVSISVQFSGSKESLIDGYITNINAHIDDHEPNSYIEIIGMDNTILLDLEEKEVTWEKMDDSAIAQKIFLANNFVPKVDSSKYSIKYEDLVLIQRGTDIDFLKMLARRNGFECYVEKTTTAGTPTGYFKKPDVNDENKEELYIHFDEKSNLSNLDISIDGLRPMSAEIKQKNKFNAKTVISEIDKKGISNLGKIDLSKLYKLTSGKPLTKVLLSRYSTDVSQNMDSLVESVVNEGSWFVVAKGVVNAEKYEHVLDAKKIVKINGAGDTYDGKYYVTKVLHKFTPESYIQEFEAKRNALEIWSL